MYWEKIKIDDREVFNIVSANIRLTDNGLQDIFEGLSQEEIDRLEKSVPKEYGDLPLFVNGFPVVSIKEDNHGPT